MKKNNALNLSYEDKNFTPVLTFGGASTGITYAKQVGTYIRWGGMIDISMQIILTNKGTATGNAQIKLPYSCRSTSDYTCTVTLSNVNFGSNKSVKGYVDAGDGYLTLVVMGNGAAKSKGDHTMFTNTSELTVTGRYFIT